MLFGIICVTVLFYLLTRGGKSELAQMLCMSTPGLRDLQLWRPLSSLLVNISAWNLFFEMFAIYIFGSIIAPRLGATKILSIYLFSGIFANLLWAAVYWNTPAAICGASGAVNGIIMASAIVAPNLQMYMLFIPFPVKLRTLALVFMVLSLILSGMTPFALLDIGGFLGAYLFMRLFDRKNMEWDMLTQLTGQKNKPNTIRFERPAPRSGNQGNYPDRNEVDRILDKLSRDGINSLTPEEIALLEKVRDQMNRNSR